MHAESPGQGRKLMVLFGNLRQYCPSQDCQTLLSLRMAVPLPMKSFQPQWKSGHGL